MLIYHPAHDPYHAAFRLLRLLEALPRSSYKLERIRILDFYLLFPEQLQDVKLPSEARRYRRDIPPGVTPYNRIEDPQRIFAQIEPFQQEALRLLAAKGLIDVVGLARGDVRRTNTPIPGALADRVVAANLQAGTVFKLLTGPLAIIDLYGKSGLKARTDLFEYRYDPA